MIFVDKCEASLMTTMETKQDICTPFSLKRNSLRKTCAEIINETRQSLRVKSTRRPFTPRDGQRQLFGRNSVRAEQKSRPPSTFSLHARNFDANSRPGSGTRLLPLDHKPNFPVACCADKSSKDFPESLSGPAEARKGLARARGRLLKPGLPSKTCTDGKLNPNQEQHQQLSDEKPHNGLLKHGACKTRSESKVLQPVNESRVCPTDRGDEQRTELEHRIHAPGVKEDAESLVWNNVIGPLLQELESVAADRSEGSLDCLCDLCDALHGALADVDMLGRRCKRRSGILRTLFRLVDLDSARLNLHIAKLCLALCVSGNNLLNICKLVFQISHSETNDILFEQNSIIDSLLAVLVTEDVCVSGEALFYCVATLKFLSGNSIILSLLLAKNCMEVSHKLILKLCDVKDPHFTIAGHILVQLTATLRNFADHPDSRALFVSLSTLPTLCVVLHRRCEDKDICTNISRIFSKLSSYSECCLALARTPDCCPLFLDLLSKHQQKQDLVVRLLFTLGNLTAKSDECKLQLFQCNSCMPTLLHLFNLYQRKSLGLVALTVSVQEADDVLVKLVRVLANMCIHPAVGPSLATNTAFIQLLMETLELRSVQESEELLVNVAATINNLSFYQEEDSEIQHNQLTIAKLMLKLVLSSSTDAILEAIRVYGNLSQDKSVRDFIIHNKVHKFVVTLLDAKRAETCFSACGVLTNLALDPPKRAHLMLEGAQTKLVDCLRDFGPPEWQLAAQACQALCNLSGGSSETLLNMEERGALLETLTVYSDEETALKLVQNEDKRGFHRECWELDFLPVAQKLMKVLQSQDGMVGYTQR